MIQAAGILFVTSDRKALFVKRGAGVDHAGEWALPGGKSEGDETPEQTAVRETREEIGFVPRGSRALLTRSIFNPATAIAVMPPPAPAEALPLLGAGESAPAAFAPPADEVDFSTFLQTVKDTFDPVLNEEHTGYAWASVEAPPEPLHPGVVTALARLDMNELDVARAMAAGQLTSPQRYHNVTLFAIRISGVGTSYRSSHDEFVWRDPAVYMNEDFRQRCNGLPVIFEHPKGVVLDSDEFSDRMVGTVFLPYLRPELDEVWGIAKIYDDAAIKIMVAKQMSTSPSVVLRRGENTKMKLDDGSTLLIEGEPALLDHIAICGAGVWDKGGEPSGVRNDSSSPPPGEIKVTEKTEADIARADAAGAGTLEAILNSIASIGGRVDAVMARMDAEDERRMADKKGDEEEEEEAKKKADADAEEEEKKAKEKADADAPNGELEMADKARRDAKADADKEDEDEKKADSIAERVLARLNGPMNDAQRRISQVERNMPKHLSDADYQAMAGTQAKADRVFQAFGDAASRPLQGEDNNAYRRRLATELKIHSERAKGIDLMAIADSAAFDLVEDMIYNDAMSAAKNPVNLESGMLREIQSEDMTGRRISTFHGEPSAWMAPFRAEAQRVTMFGQGG